MPLADRLGPVEPMVRPGEQRAGLLTRRVSCDCLNGALGLNRAPGRWARCDDSGTSGEV
ncbi:hypothetical protein ACIPSE_10970 [Streptomyces sp. NPDC090106]|uniref:hypothetical protein n=1 Tax=Streptomyces sp. NPDC090106 TaxID=3365946 RepID=UPI0037F33DA8